MRTLKLKFSLDITPRSAPIKRDNPKSPLAKTRRLRPGGLFFVVMLAAFLLPSCVSPKSHRLLLLEEKMKTNETYWREIRRQDAEIAQLELRLSECQSREGNSK